MSKIKMLTTENCGPCKVTKNILKGYIEDGTIEVIDITGQEESFKLEYPTLNAVPFFTDDKHKITVDGFLNEDMFKEKFEMSLSIQEIYEDVIYGIEIGNTCPVCKVGKVEDLGGCHSCTNCGVQLKCGL